MLTIKPKTRKEIYLAYLSGDMSLELPEPLTRDEVNLYNLCKNKAYGEYTTVKEVLAECQPELVQGNEDSVPNAELGDINLVAGEQYIVVFDGIEYRCICVEPESGWRYLGNGNIMEGLDDTGEPFVIDTLEGNVAVLATTEPAGVHTISIRQEATEVKQISGKYVEGMGYEEDGVVHPINPKFLPSGGGGGQFVVFITLDENGTPVSADKTLDEILDALREKKQVVADLSGGGYFMFMTLDSANDDSVGRKQAHFYSAQVMPGSIYLSGLSYHETNGLEFTAHEITPSEPA